MSDSESKEEVKPAQKRFNCEKCNYGTNVKCNLEKHLTTKAHLNEGNEDEEIEVVKPKHKRFNCEKCKYETNVKCNMDKHLLTKGHLEGTINHAEKVKRPDYFECKKCAYKTPDFSNFKRHMKSDKHKDQDVNQHFTYEDLNKCKASNEFSKYLKDYKQAFGDYLLYHKKKFEKVKKLLRQLKEDGMNKSEWEGLKTELESINIGFDELQRVRNWIDKPSERKEVVDI